VTTQNHCLSCGAPLTTSEPSLCQDCRKRFGNMDSARKRQDRFGYIAAVVAAVLMFAAWWFIRPMLLHRIEEQQQEPQPQQQEQQQQGVPALPPQQQDESAPPAEPLPPPPKKAAAISIGTPHTCSGVYPYLSVQLREQGTTTLAFTITKEGTVRDITVAKSSGYPRLDDAAVACAAEWRYRPAARKGKYVDAPWKAAVQWILPD
jgi:TonB family protein